MTDNDNAPTPTTTTLDDIRDIASAILDILTWIASFNLTNFLCRISGHGFDPEGCPLPEWKNAEMVGEGSQAFQILPDAYMQQEGERLATYDKVVYLNGKEVSKEPWATEFLTQKELIALHQYKNPVLTNLLLAKGVKYYLRNGHNDHAIAVLLGYKEKTIQHYRLALEKASHES